MKCGVNKFTCLFVVATQGVVKHFTSKSLGRLMHLFCVIYFFHVIIVVCLNVYQTAGRHVVKINLPRGDVTGFLTTRKDWLSFA